MNTALTGDLKALLNESEKYLEALTEKCWHLKMIETDRQNPIIWMKSVHSGRRVPENVEAFLKKICRTSERRFMGRMAGCILVLPSNSAQ